MADELWDTMVRFHHEVTLPALRAALLEERRDNGLSHAETRRHFDISTESLKHEIRLVAEKVIRVEEKLEREAASIRAEMNERFAETHALIRFSHTELDGRIRSLENSRP